jgi:hypothetical protein
MDALLTTDACTLPTPERPLRLAEFDDLFREHVVAVDRQGLTARLTLSGGAGLLERVADLTAREASCCSFFEFSAEGDDDGLVLTVGVPPLRAEILEALSSRAEELSA